MNKNKLLASAISVTLLISFLCSCRSQSEHTHIFEEWITEKYETCTEDGLMVCYCDCGEKQTKVIPAKGHSYVSGVCSICGEKQDSISLPTVSPVITENPTEAPTVNQDNMTWTPVGTHSSTLSPTEITETTATPTPKPTATPTPKPTATPTVETVDEALEYCTLEDGTLSVAVGDALYLDKIVIPNTHEGKTVSTIALFGFEFCENLTEITIPDSITSIRTEAFSFCTKLETIIFEGTQEQWRKIDKGDFCNGNTPVTIVHCADGDTFFYESNGLLLVLNEDNSSYSVEGLYDTSKTEIVIPETYKGLSVTKISRSAFIMAENVSSIIIPDSVTTIESYAFAKSRLSSIIIPDSVTSIGEYAFQECHYLRSVVLSDNLTSIPRYAFEGCGLLSSVTIPDSVTSIESGAFRSCVSLRSITIPNSVTSIESGAFLGSALTSITISESVTSISRNTFSSCISLTSIIIPDSVTSIGDGAFAYCGRLTSITIPNSVTYIDRLAFVYCTHLTSITFNGTKEQWNSISKIYEWDMNIGDYTVHCTDGDIPKQ